MLNLVKMDAQAWLVIGHKKKRCFLDSTSTPQNSHMWELLPQVIMLLVDNLLRIANQQTKETGKVWKLNDSMQGTLDFLGQMTSHISKTLKLNFEC